MGSGPRSSMRSGAGFHRPVAVCSFSARGAPCQNHCQLPAAIPEVPASEIIDWSGKYPSRPLFDERRAIPTRMRAERAIAALGPGVPFLIVYYGSDGAGGWQPLSRPLRTLTTLDRFGLVTWHGGEAMLRMLQPSELIRAMGFDRAIAGESYRLPVGTRRDRIKLLGNGVCPPVMQAIVEHMTGVGTTEAAPERAPAREHVLSVSAV